MVKALAIVIALAGVAAAEEAPNRLVEMGFHFGGQEIGNDEIHLFGLSIGVERRLAGALRGALEYEYLWIGRRVTEDMYLDGSGHRAQLSARTTLLETAWSEKNIRWYGDLEGGGGVLYADQPMERTVKAHAFVGIRAGYSLRSRRGTKASTRFEAVMIARAIASEDGPGLMFGMGMGWGD